MKFTWALILSIQFFSRLTFAQDFASALVPPKFQKTVFSYEGLFHQESQFPEGNAAVTYQEISLSAPVYKTEDSSYSLTLNANELLIRPDQNNFSNLYDVRLGASYTKELGAKRLWSMSLRGGSASDKIFANPSVTTIGATWLYSFPADETSNWLLLLDYSNNRSILNGIPLPGFAYFYTPSRDSRIIAGLPFVAGSWMLSEKIGVEGFYLIPWTLKVSTFYKINDFTKAHVGLDFSQKTYYMAERQNSKERIFYDEKKIFIGAKSPLSRSVVAELDLGYAFDRRIFMDESFENSPANATSIGNDYYFKLGLKLIL